MTSASIKLLDNLTQDGDKGRDWQWCENTVSPIHDHDHSGLFLLLENIHVDLI